MKVQEEKDSDRVLHGTVMGTVKLQIQAHMVQIETGKDVQEIFKELDARYPHYCQCRVAYAWKAYDPEFWLPTGEKEDGGQPEIGQMLWHLLVKEQLNNALLVVVRLPDNHGVFPPVEPKTIKNVYGKCTDTIMSHYKMFVGKGDRKKKSSKSGTSW